jgi:hypothetical protein
MGPKEVAAIIVGMVGLGGCSRNISPLSGCVLGYDDGGIAQISLETGTKRYVHKREPDHFWTMPVWDYAKRFVCADTEKASPLLAMLPCGTADSETIYIGSPNSQVKDIALTTNGIVLFFVADRNPESDSQTKLVALDKATKNSRVVVEANFIHGLRIQPRGEDQAIVGHRLSRADGTWIQKICIVKLTDGSLEDLDVDKASSWALSEDGKVLLIFGPDKMVRSLDLGTRKLSELYVEQIPGTSFTHAAPFFVHNEDVVLWCEHDVIQPLGFYRLNVRSGRVSLISQEKVYHPSYLPNCCADSGAEK